MTSPARIGRSPSAAVAIAVGAMGSGQVAFRGPTGLQGDAGLTYDPSTDTFAVAGSVHAPEILVNTASPFSSDPFQVFKNANNWYGGSAKNASSGAAAAGVLSAWNNLNDAVSLAMTSSGNTDYGARLAMLYSTRPTISVIPAGTRVADFTTTGLSVTGTGTFSGNIAGTTGTFRLDQNVSTKVQVRNATAGTGALALFEAANDSSAVAQFGFASSAYLGYGSLTPSAAFAYGNGAGGLALMADNASGTVRVAAGGNVTQWTFGTAGGLSGSGPISAGAISGTTGTYLDRVSITKTDASQLLLNRGANQGSSLLAYGAHGSLYAIANGYYDGAVWQRNNVSFPLWYAGQDTVNDLYAVARAAPGANPVAGFTNGLVLTNAGHLLLGGAATDDFFATHLQVKGNANNQSDGSGLFFNASTGNAAGATVFIGQSTAGSKYGYLGYLGSGFSPSGPFAANQILLGCGAGATGGFLFVTQNASPIVFATNSVVRGSVGATGDWTLNGNVGVGGILSAGSGPTTLTGSTGLILASALPTSVLRSARVLYASQQGAALNGTTDDTTALQAALNLGGASSPIVLVLDGPAVLTSGLNVKSNTTIVAYGCTVTLKNASNRAILRNATRTRGSTTDENIAVLGGTWDGNRSNQTGTDIYATGVLVQESDGTFLTGLQFYGVVGLTVRDVHVKNCKAFAIHTANVYNVRGDNVWIENDNTATTQDGWHFNGPASDVRLSNLRIWSYDDCLAFNADDGTDDIATSNKFGPYVGTGTISHVHVQGLRLGGGLFGVRIMSRTSRIDQVYVHGIHGEFRNYWCVVDGFVGSNNGNYGSIDLESSATAAGSPDLGANVGGLVVTNNVERLHVRCTRHDWADNRSAVWVQSGSAVDQLDVDLSIRDSVAGAPQGPISVTGHVKKLHATGSWHSTDSSVTGGFVYAVGGTVDRAVIEAVIPPTCTHVYPGSTLTLVGDGAASMPTGQSVLGSNYTTTNAFADAGPSVTLPSAGDYVIQADVRTTCYGGDAVVVQLTKNGSAVAYTERLADSPAAFSGGTASLTWVLQGAAAGDVVKLQAKYQGTITTTPTVNSDANGRTVLAYSKQGY